MRRPTVRIGPRTTGPSAAVRRITALRPCYVSSTASLAPAAAAAERAAERLLPARGDCPPPRSCALRPLPCSAARRPSPTDLRPGLWAIPPPPSCRPATASSVRPWLREPSATRGRAAGRASTPPWLWSCGRLRRLSSRGVGESPRPRARPSGHGHACSPRGAAVASRLDDAIRVDCAARRLVLACGTVARAATPRPRLASPLCFPSPFAAQRPSPDMSAACRRRVRRELSPLLSRWRDAVTVASGKDGSSACSPRGNVGVSLASNRL